MNKPRFLIVTADTCGACRAFKENSLKPLLEKLKNTNVDVLQANLPDMSPGNLVNVQPEIPATVQTYIKWYPIMLLFPANSWEPEVYDNGSLGHKPETIVDWINKTISSNSRFSTINKGGKKKIRYVLVSGKEPVSVTRGSQYVKRTVRKY